MQSTASRMMAVGKVAADSQPASSIFGSAAGLARSIERAESYRISIYPVICDDMPDEAMGIAACLSWLLDQYPDLKVYRCVAKIDPEDDSDEISRDDYQFSPEEWELEGLDDNIVLYGELTQEASGLLLRLNVDKSLAGAEEESQFVFRAETLAGVVNLLPAIARELAQAITADSSQQLIVDYPPVVDSVELPAMLESVFGWNLDLYLQLWDVRWADDEIQAQFHEIAETCRGWPTGFSYWCLGMTARQALQPGLEEISEAVLPLLEGVFDGQPSQRFGAAAVAMGLEKLGFHDRAVEFLRPFLTDAAEPSIWLVLIDLHLGAGRAEEAIDVCQLALENGIENTVLYWRYVELLELAEERGISIEDVLLIDPDEIAEEEQITWEAVSALESILRLEPDNSPALRHMLTYLIEMEDDGLWDYFERLVSVDPKAATIVEILEQLADLDDLEPAYDMLLSTVNDQNRAYVFANLAQLALLDERYDRAGEYVEQARGQLPSDDDDLKLELQRLALMAKLPGFEARFADIKMSLNAKGQVSEKDVDLLEEAIEIAPLLIDPYITLARIYVSWQDHESATEVLSEAQGRIGAHPRIHLGRAQLLWNRRQRPEAVETLNDGIAAFPNDVSLLTQLASYLIDNGQLDDARQYVERVERIAPASRLAAQLRHLIAQKLNA